jgi:hypothetical protein
MHRAHIVAVAAMIVTVGALAGFVIPAAAQSVTAFEGARLIVGDGRVIENATWSWTARGSLTLEGPPTFVSLPAPGA